MQRGTTIRRALLRRLLRAASLPAVVSLAAGCLTEDTRCFEHQNDDCPLPQHATPFIPLACDEQLESVDSDAERRGAECCYDVTIEQVDNCVIEGRPLLLEATAVVASPRERSEWVPAQASPDVAALDERQREALAHMWTQAGLFEHASVASFARYSLSLMAVGAPPSLLEEAHRAALDEVRHAAAAFGLASAYRGAPVGPSRLPLPELMPVSGSLEDLAVSTAIEACVNETLAVLVAIEQLSRVTDLAVRGVLERIVDDESRHAALAWCTVRWAIQNGGPQVRAAVEKALRETRPERGASEMSIAERDAVLEGHGLLDERARTEAMQRGYDEIIAPCVRALFAGDDAVSLAV